MATALPQRSIGKGQAAVSGAAIAYGCMSLHGAPFYKGAPSEDESVEIVRQVLRSGVNVLNTADLYGKNQENETMLGKALQGIPREKVIVVDKWGPYLGPEGMVMDASPERCRKNIDAQLARLQTDYIDVWVYRGKDPKVPIEDTIRAMKEAVVAGKVKHIGLSELGAEDIRKAHAIHPITLLEQEWSLWSRDIETDLLPTANELGIGILAYSPLGRGMLTGAFKSLDDLPEGDWRRQMPRFEQEAFMQNRALVEKLEELAAKKGCTAGQLAIAWLLHKSPNVIPLFGSKSPKNIESSIASVHVKLTPEEFQAIDSSFAPSKVKGERYGAMAHATYHYSKDEAAH